MKTSTYTRQSFSDVVQTVTSVPVRLQDGYTQGFGALLNITVNAPVAGTFTAAVTDILTKADHGYVTGLKVQVSNAGGALPTGLSAATDYFVVVLTSSTFKLATTLANAVAATPVVVDITGAGTGTQTVTPVAVSATYKLQVSADDVNYVDLAAATAITASTTVLVEKLAPMYNYVRVVYTMTAGSLAVVQNIQVKGE